MALRAVSSARCGLALIRSDRSARAKRGPRPRYRSGCTSCARRCAACRNGAGRCPTGSSSSRSRPRQACSQAARIRKRYPKLFWWITCPPAAHPGMKARPPQVRKALHRVSRFFRTSESHTMNKRRPVRAENLRLALAQEAARVMAEHGIRDFLAAKRKAAERFGVVDGAVLPKNIEIEAALAQYQRLFAAESHAESLLTQRHVALQAMRCLAEYAPRLVGSVLSGTATAHCDVQLHLLPTAPRRCSSNSWTSRFRMR